MDLELGHIDLRKSELEPPVEAANSDEDGQGPSQIEMVTIEGANPNNPFEF